MWIICFILSPFLEWEVTSKWEECMLMEHMQFHGWQVSTQAHANKMAEMSCDGVLSTIRPLTAWAWTRPTSARDTPYTLWTRSLCVDFGIACVDLWKVDASSVWVDRAYVWSLYPKSITVRPSCHCWACWKARVCFPHWLFCPCSAGLRVAYWPVSTTLSPGERGGEVGRTGCWSCERLSPS